MPSHSYSFHTFALLSVACLWSLSLAAQQTAPAPAPPPDVPTSAAAPAAPPPVIFQNPIPATQLAFLNGYAGQPTKVLLKDKRFRSLLKLTVPHCRYHYGRDMPLSDAIAMVLDGSKQPVGIIDGRYAVIMGSRGPYLRGRGFLWFDMQSGDALGVFYFQPTNGEPTPTLTVFSRQLTDTDLGISQLPLPFAAELRIWDLLAETPAITPRYFIPANGKKYVLIHDDDYCANATYAPTTNPGVCQQLNAEAADADMNAAYFMHETHNAAYATAWVLGPNQMAWMGLRERRCGVLVACRIEMARRRTRLLIGRRPSAPPRGRR